MNSSSSQLNDSDLLRRRGQPSRNLDPEIPEQPEEENHSNHQPMDMGKESHGFCGYLVIILVIIIYVILLPFTIWFSFTLIQTYERGISLRLGKLRQHRGSPILGSGIQFVLPCIDQVIKIDMRTIVVNIPPQEVLTRDSVTVDVDAIVYMHVVDPASAMLCVQQWKESTQLLSVSALRSVIGNYTLVDLLSQRATLDKNLKNILDGATDAWGIKVERVEIKDVSLPQDMKRAMAAEAQASRAASAKIIEAKGELDSAEMLHQAALKISTTPAALHLRYLQTLATIATEQNSTIVFPLAMEWLSAFKEKG